MKVDLKFGWTRVAVCFAVIGLINLASCTSSRSVTGLYPVKKGEVIVLKQACHFIDNAGIDLLVPVGNRYLHDYESNSKGIIPEGTRVTFLGAYAESGFMEDTHIRTYGRILDGKFRRRKVSMDIVMEAQSEEANQALPKIEREILSGK